MKYLLLSFGIFMLATTSSQAQFKIGEKGLTILVSDGTDQGRNSELQPPGDIPASYDQIEAKSGSGGSGRAGGSRGRMMFSDPIRELGMTDCIQAAAFLERPENGILGFMLIFSLNDSIGGQQATLIQNGEIYRGVYRLIRQKSSPDEEVPVGMANYKVAGSFLLLGIS